MVCRTEAAIITRIARCTFMAATRLRVMPRRDDAQCAGAHHVLHRCGPQVVSVRTAGKWMDTLDVHPRGAIGGSLGRVPPPAEGNGDEVPDQLRPREAREDHDVELTIVDHRVRRHGKSESSVRTVRYRDGERSSGEHPVVEMEHHARWPVAEEHPESRPQCLVAPAIGLLRLTEDRG